MFSDKVLREIGGGISEQCPNKAQISAKKRRDAMQKLRGSFQSMDRTTATDISQARELLADMRRDLLQSSDGGYPAGYEELLESYYKALSTGQK